MEKIKKWVDLLVSVSFVILCGVFIFVLLRDGLPTAAKTKHEPPGLSAGQAAPRHAAISYATTDKTVVLFLSTSCRFCTESLPAYGRIARAIREKGLAVQTVALFPDQAKSGTRYLEQEKELASMKSLKVVGSVDLKEMGIRGTPTVALVGKDGLVRRVWIGKLSERAEKDLLEMVTEN